MVPVYGHGDATACWKKTAKLASVWITSVILQSLSVIQGC
jgi:hypothetical protein